MLRPILNGDKKVLINASCARFVRYPISRGCCVEIFLKDERLKDTMDLE